VLANNDNLDGNAISKMITATDGEDPHRVMYTENHDKASNQQNGRIPAIVDPSGTPSNPSYWAFKKAFMGIGMLFTCSGTPMLFYGQEFMTYSRFDYPFPPNLNWSLASINQGATYYVQDLSTLRTNKNGTTAGLSGSQTSMLQMINNSTTKIFQFSRYSNNPSDATVVVANMYQTNYTSFQLKNMPSDGVWNVRFNGDSTRYSSQLGNFGVSQKSITVSGGTGNIMLPEYAIVILSK